MNQIASITDIPDTDIFLFLSENNIKISKIKTNIEAYQIVLELIQSNIIQNAPDSIVNWIHASIVSKQYNINDYNIMDIILQDNITDLAQLLELKEVNKGDIIEILWYLKKLDGLDIFSSVSHSSIFNILLYLDYKTIKILSRLSIIVHAICSTDEFNPILRKKYQEYEENKNMQYY